MFNIPDLSTISLILSSLICHIRVSTNKKFVKITRYTLLKAILNRWIDNDNNISPRKNVDIAVIKEKKLQCNPFSECDTYNNDAYSNKIVIS